MDVRAFIAWARERRALVDVGVPVAPYLELARVAAALGDRPVLFNSIAGFTGWRAISGVCARREHFAAALNCAEDQLTQRIAHALESPQEPLLVEAGPCHEIVAPQVDLTTLPIPHFHPKDGGRYITAGVSAVRDPELGPNISIHRLMILDERRCVGRLIEGRGTHTALSKVPGDLPIAIAIGCPVQVMLAAATSPPQGVDEIGVAQALAPTPVVACETVDLVVPAEAEVVLEGRITRETVAEGPFPDLTGTMDRVRQQPVIVIDRVTHRADPVFHALLPGGLEHKNLMGMPREPTIFAAVNEVCKCMAVFITPGGSSWLHAVVQIDKAHDEDGRKAIWAAFRGHSSLKHVVVVDTDVNPYNTAQVEWAIATRFQASQDLVVLADEPGSSLDPSAEHVPGHKSRTSKMGLDATMPAGRSHDGYLPVPYEEVDLSRYLD